MKKDWMVLAFRRGKVFAQIYAPTEATVRMFAQLVYQQTMAQSNKRLQRTGISVPLIDNLPLAQLSPGR